LDGLLSTNYTGQVMVLCTSNAPWLLDEALCRRLEKRILVNLPDDKVRGEMIARFMDGISVSKDVDDAFYDEISSKTIRSVTKYLGLLSELIIELKVQRCGSKAVV
jgi:SpoVK/Ycf46/Vps4 family AAA+-type ATPase